MKNIVLVFLFLFTTQLVAQYGTPNFRKVGVIREGNIRTVFTNFGVIAQPGTEGPRFAWKYDRNGYAGDLSTVIGLELPIADYRRGNIPPDGIPDTIHSVIITLVNRPGGGEGANGVSYTFEPIPGYASDENLGTGMGVAMSNLPETWPDIWPDHPEYGTGVWNGLYGPGPLNIESQEAYYAMDDFNDIENYLENDFLPSTVDTSMRGHGIEVKVRYISLDHFWFDDILFRIYDITNKSTHNYQKLVLGNLVGSYIGVESPEWQDDATLFYPKDNLILTYDFDKYIDPNANPQWIGGVGMFGESFIHTPTNNKIASFENFVPAGMISMADDEAMWGRITPGTYNYPSSIVYIDSVPYATRGEDGDYIWGGEYFSLNASETKRVVTAVAFGESQGEILRKIKLAEALYHSNFDLGPAFNTVQITSHLTHRTVSGNDIITWNSNNPNESVQILYSSDAGKSWETITKNAPNNGTYNWNSAQYEDAAFAKLMIFINNSQGFTYAVAESDYFTVNNPGNGSPYVKQLFDWLNNYVTLTEDYYDFDMLIGDPDNDPLLLKIYYSTNTDTTFYLSQTYNLFGDTAVQSITVNLKIMPNTNQLRLKFEVSDGQLVYSDITPKFIKENTRQVVPTQNFVWLNKFTEVPVEIRLIDANQMTGEEYIITFSDSSINEPKTFSVYNVTRDEFTLFKQPFYPYSESVLFDGMTLYTEDFLTAFDQTISGWSSPVVNDLRPIVDLIYTPQYKGYRFPFDYKLVFSDTYSDSSNKLTYIFGNNAPPVNPRLNFKVFRKVTNEWERIQFAFTEPRQFRKDTLSFGDIVVCSDPSGQELSWRVAFFGDSSSNVPSAGDTLYLYTKKGLSVFDTLKVFGIAEIFTEEFKNSNIDLSIPDGGEISNILQVSISPPKLYSFGLSEIIVEIDTILHPNISDLVLLLIHEGITDTIVSQVGGDGDNIIGCRLSDEYLIPVADGTAPITGKFKPQNPISPFYSTNLNGEWELKVFDVVTGNIGTLNSWGLNFNFLILSDKEDENEHIVTQYELFQNYPNPFNPNSTIRFSINERVKVSLKIFDILGREISTLVNEEKAAGRYEVVFNANGLASGIYFYRLQAGNFVQTRKMILLK